MLRNAKKMFVKTFIIIIINIEYILKNFHFKSLYIHTQPYTQQYNKIFCEMIRNKGNRQSI